MTGTEGFVPADEDLDLPEPKTDAECKALLGVAERAIEQALDHLDVLTPEGWNIAYAQAIHEGRIHLARRIKDAKGLALYRGRDRR